MRRIQIGGRLKVALGEAGHKVRTMDERQKSAWFARKYLRKLSIPEEVDVLIAGSPEWKLLDRYGILDQPKLDLYAKM